MRLGVAYMRGDGVVENAEQAVRWFRRAARQGDVHAQRSLGMAYRYGHGVEEDPDEAFRWYRQAARQDDPTSQCRVGQAYEFGQGVEEDEERALRWYRRAARQGDPVARQAVEQLTAPPTPPDKRPLTVEICIELAEDDLPSEEELELRNRLEDVLLEEGVGEFYGAGGGSGEMDIALGVEDFAEAIRQIRPLLYQFDLFEITTIRQIDEADY